MFFHMYSEALGPSLAKMLDMSIWDPKSEKEVDDLLDTQIDLSLFVFNVIFLSHIMLTVLFSVTDDGIEKLHLFNE